MTSSEPQGPVRRGLCSVVFAVCVVTLLAGCSGSSPRFGSGTGKPASRTAVGGKEPKSGARFASPEAEEERREDDKRPDPKIAEDIGSGTRDFRREKNPAITPLDQSRMMREISKFMGTPYVLGGSNAEGMDCSGYTMTVYKNAAHRDLPRTSSEQAAMGRQVRLESLQFGDLVFFNTTGDKASHVGIYLGDDLFAHASVSQGVTISSLQSTYFKKRYEGARRIID